MKLADYIAQFVADLGVKDIFLISGGGMMHLLDSFGKNKHLHTICNLNEQACSICADSYSQYTNNLGVCLLTTGPGGTNGLTGVAASYLDSVPVLIISGQCKTADFAEKRGVRQYGAQEVDIIAMAKPITKYSFKVTDKNTIRYHLEKAVYLALEGRPGPVWLDIPLDIQAAEINPEQLPPFIVPAQNQLAKDVLTSLATELYGLLKQAKRPLFLVGGGVMAANCQNKLRLLIEKLNIPTLSTWRAKDFMPQNHPLYFGMPGAPAYRYSNNILQNCDLLIIVGSRLNQAITIYNEPGFAAQAQKIIVDIDKNEIAKLAMDFALQINYSAADFVNIMQNLFVEQKTEQKWHDFCHLQKQKYPLTKEKQPYDNQGKADGYFVAEIISKYAQENDIFVGSSSGRTCGISHLGFFLKEGQRFITSMGLGSMGFTVPSAIGCCFASDKKRVIALEGDGSLQHNIQELQVIKQHNLPIKLFVLANEGYASIYMMQKNNFGENYVACNELSGLSFPQVADIAHAYGLAYYRINNDSEVESIVQQVLSDNKPAICEVLASIYFDEIPKSITIAHPDGTFSSSSLENLYPFLSEAEIKENILDWD